MNGPRDPDDKEKQEDEVQENDEQTVEFDDDLYYPSWLDEIDFDYEDELRD